MSGVYERKDKLYREAKAQGYRSRAAYKLIELDKKFKLLRPGVTVLDLGCFPGGWLQVAAERVGLKGKVIGIDLKFVEPLVGLGKTATTPSIIEGDICSEDIQRRVAELCGGKVNLILSDLSPKLSGIRFRDAYLSAELVGMAFAICEKLLAAEGTFVCKIFPGQECEEIAKTIRSSFSQFSRENLDSSRKTSQEVYFVARNFKPVRMSTDVVQLAG